MGPLAGTKIIDLTSVLMGPSATQMLGDMGADVIKVESPDGDLVRQIGPQRNAGMGAIFLNANRSKRSICLDLKQPAGREALLRLADDADILTYNIRPQAMTRLGLDYETLAARNPRLIYAGLFGFGQDGPYAARPAYDDLIQGASVMSALIARAGDGTPRYVPTAIADRVVGLAAVGAICATLVNRDRTGLGQRVDIPMFETMVSFVLSDHLSGLTFEPPLDGGGYARQLSPERRPYRTRDGYICAVIYTDKQWTNFLKAIGREDLPASDPRFARFADRQKHVDFVYGELALMFTERTTAEWMELLDRADVPAMPMHDFTSILDDPHLTRTGFFQTHEHPTEGPVRAMRMSASWSRTPVAIRQLAPRKGEHGLDILREAGFGEDEIAALLLQHAMTVPAQAAGADADL
ncbi:CoA transferase [Azospirillum sp. RWY-5-1]|uniref:CoA transferase n=1 Tax=Azospirillum oleiclasticum TaxID=2735135 RepID=A0ABX2TIU2_9PROT|nr:CoA transferase [Azospirillum oleiclasticum]NYZ16148.1 CoA transferase [Azospirillum oleiclasticum]NYZ23028.1 CoA transferase [Azospirillum oleiclasticum]